MVEPLKNQFGVDIPGKITKMILPVYPEFDSDVFIRDTLKGYDELELMPRARKVSGTLRLHLPESYAKAVEILLASLGPKLVNTKDFGMAPFLYQPYVLFVAEYGLDEFDLSMYAQYELTQRFTAEFSIRPFLERYPDETLKQLKVWTQDSNVHVRRLVSEGTRPRLPWAKRLRQFQINPNPVIELLELLKDDTELYVRRSVANNLNDIGKDNPSVLIETASKWKVNASKERLWLIRHALRSAVKRADTNALTILGFGDDSNIAIDNANIIPEHAKIGGSVTISADVTNKDSQNRQVLANCSVHFVKANEKTSPKVFKIKHINLRPKETIRIQKSISLSKMTTRVHYAGTHKVDIILNGAIRTLGTFELERH